MRFKANFIWKSYYISRKNFVFIKKVLPEKRKEFHSVNPV